MAGDLVRFVDSIASSPTTRLDLNDETSWWVKSFSAPPPRLRRSVAENAMRDGISVGSASYGSRTLTLELECRKSTQDLAATEIQKLWRELDRATNFIQYQPTGATKPVFFKTYRSDSSQLEDVMAQAAMRRVTIELLADPFAMGLRESLGPFTIANDATGTNQFGVSSATLGTVIGDVPAPAIVIDTSAKRSKGYLCRTAESRSAVLTQQGESSTVGTDTANPGGGPDAAMSGTGANNYVRTSFATQAAMTPRVKVTAASTFRPAAYRVVVALRRSDATSVIQARWSDADVAGSRGDTMTVPLTTSRQLVDLGVWSRETTQERPVNTGSSGGSLWVDLARISGTGTVDVDLIMLVSASEQVLSWSTAAADDATRDFVIDGDDDAVYPIVSGGDIFTATGATLDPPTPAAGSVLDLRPNAANNIGWVISGTAFDKTPTSSLTFHYWPRYLFVRPVST